MKTINKPAVIKLMTRFDNELKNIISNDLKVFTIKNPFLIRNKQANLQPTLSVA
jgi:hypothetical protein